MLGGSHYDVSHRAHFLFQDDSVQCVYYVSLHPGSDAPSVRPSAVRLQLQTDRESKHSQVHQQPAPR